jgi:hypothetical protein
MQVLSPILLSLSPWRLWREHLTRHLGVSGSCQLSLGVLSKEEKTNKEKGVKFLSGARTRGGLEFWKNNLVLLPSGLSLRVGESVELGSFWGGHLRAQVLQNLGMN